MKKLFAITILIILSSLSVYAADVALTLDGQEFSKPVELDPKQNVEFKLMIDSGVYIKDIEASSKNKILQTFIDEELQKLNMPGRALEPRTKVKTTTLPELLPQGTHTIDVSIKYEKDGIERTFKETMKTDIPRGSNLLGTFSGMASDDIALAIRDKLKSPKVETVSRSLEPVDLDGLDMSEIGLDQKEVLSGNYQSEKIRSLTQKQGVKVITGAETDEAKDAIAKLKRKEPSEIEKTLLVFEVTNPNTGKTTKVSKVILSLSSDQSLKGFQAIEYVPKSTAQSSKDMAYSEYAEVLQEDPIVKWDLGHMSGDGLKEYSYTVNKELEKIESVTSAGGEKLSWIARLVAYIAEKFIKK